MGYIHRFWEKKLAIPISLAILLISLFFVLVTYNPADFSDLHFPGNAKNKSFFGIVGAEIARALYFSFGFASYTPIIFGLLAVAWFSCFRAKDNLYLHQAGLACIILTFWVSTALEFIKNSPYSDKIVSYGGIMGLAIADSLEFLLGNAASLLFWLLSLGFFSWVGLSLVVKLQEEEIQKHMDNQS